MPTLRKVCSDVQSQLKANNIDDRLSFRFLASRVRDKIRSFIKQDADNRRFSKLPYLWNPFPPIEMREVSNVEIPINTPVCKTLMKSKKKLPKTVSTNYGYLFKVFTIDGQKEYTLVTKIAYQDIQAREFRDPRIKYAWIEDGYLFIPDSNVEVVKAMGMLDGDTASAGCDKPLDQEIIIPDYLLDVVKKDLINELMNSTKRITPDAKPDLNENTKT